MKKIDEILAIPNIFEKIEKLKLGRGMKREPDTLENMKNWFVEGHKIKDKNLFPDRTIVTKKGKKITDSRTGKTYTSDDETKTQKANRIAIPAEQDIVNIQTAFGVGIEPILNCNTEDDMELRLLKSLKYTMKKNRCKFNNKKEMRSWLSEQEVAEYWYAAPDTDGFWAKADKDNKGRKPPYRLKCAIWSPFRGDKLYPFYEGDDMTGFLREYKKSNSDGLSYVTCYMLITEDSVYNWDMQTSGYIETKFKHGFSKMPIIYTYCHKPYCHNIKDMRERLEKTLSSYGDCIDYHFFPYLLLKGDVKDAQGDLKNHVINMQGEGASAAYLTWDQVPDTVKFEVDTYLSQIYALTHTPRISFDNLKGIGAISGISFKFYFMDAHMQESNNEEDFGEFLQRRLNFLTAATGDINASLYTPSRTIDVDTEMVPYMIDNVSDKVTTALAATGGKAIWSRKHGMVFAGQVDHIDEELKEIEDEDQTVKAEQSNSGLNPQKDV